MTDIPGLIAIGVAAFAATNIDDIFVLMMFFSSSMIFPVKQVVLGQYIGIGLLVAISALGSFISLAVPRFFYLTGCSNVHYSPLGRSADSNRRQEACRVQKEKRI